MSIQIGDRIPDVTLRTMTAEGIETVTTTELLAGRKVVLFAVPGAFTPTCSDAHLPGYQVRGPEMLELGVDAVACVAVNDVFVMHAWGKARSIESIQLLADGNGELAEALGLVLDATGFGMGPRSRRYAMIVDDGVVTYLGVEPAGEVTVSGAEAVLAELRGGTQIAS